MASNIASLIIPSFIGLGLDFFTYWSAGVRLTIFVLDAHYFIFCDLPSILLIFQIWSLSSFGFQIKNSRYYSLH